MPGENQNKRFRVLANQRTTPCLINQSSSPWRRTFRFGGKVSEASECKKKRGGGGVTRNVSQSTHSVSLNQPIAVTLEVVRLAMAGKFGMFLKIASQ